MDKKRPPFDAIDWALVTAIVVLSAYLVMELSWPAIEVWRNRPRPGMQVPQQFVEKRGDGQKVSTLGCNYLLYLPTQYDRNSKWPLVVYLHGAGARGQDLNVVRTDGLAKQVEGSRQFDFILVSPQCPKDAGWQPALVISLTEHICNTFSIDRNRVYLTGNSMGGCGTWETACQHPDRFAAIVPLCGGGDASHAGRLSKVPVWAFHGAKDETVPLSASERMVRAVRAGGGYVEFTVYPDAGHGINDITYQNPLLYAWLLAQRRGQLQDESNDQRP